MKSEILYAFALALALGLLAILALLIQWVWVATRRRHRIRRAIAERLSPRRESLTPTSARVDLGPLEKKLLQADIQWSLRKRVVVALMVSGLLLGVAFGNGFVAFLVTGFFVGTAVVVWWRMRFQKQRRVIHENLPGTLDAVLRNMDAGRSLDQSLISSFSEAAPVFTPLVFRLQNAVDSGRDNTQLFVDFASLYRVPAMIQIAIALRTTARFGASIRPVLQQVAYSLRSQQEMRQEFLAATAETRFTAITFAVLPPGLAAYMVLINRDYSDVLLNSDTGHSLLVMAGTLQVMGMVVIWRMIQGVGRE